VSEVLEKIVEENHAIRVKNFHQENSFQDLLQSGMTLGDSSHG
jgi:hypothetical protein